MPEYILADMFSNSMGKTNRSPTQQILANAMGENPTPEAPLYDLATYQQMGNAGFSGDPYILPDHSQDPHPRHYGGPAGGPPIVSPENAFVNGVPTDALLDRLRYVESGYNNMAVSPVGAQGPYQIMPATAADPGYGVPSISAEDVWDPTRSREWAKAYLTAMYGRFNNPIQAVGAYNAGAGNVRGDIGSWPDETQGYVRKIGLVYP